MQSTISLLDILGRRSIKSTAGRILANEKIMSMDARLLAATDSKVENNSREGKSLDF
jgi:hypothetical protein